MLFAISKYTKPLAEVDIFRPAHHAYIKPLLAEGKLLISGRQNPAIGGVIIAGVKSKEEFKNILDNDPFAKEGVAEYQIVEFEPIFYHPSLNFLFE
ncbi:MAG: YCII-related [Gammaproteobacteria bacterium]|jgi:uncharacterized protein YciI|nr:YCII-related [Gammaproteobacteria bacterium]